MGSISVLKRRKFHGTEGVVVRLGRRRREAPVNLVLRECLEHAGPSEDRAFQDKLRKGLGGPCPPKGHSPQLCIALGGARNLVRAVSVEELTDREITSALIITT